jgi:hypothetical protein
LRSTLAASIVAGLVGALFGTVLPRSVPVAAAPTASPKYYVVGQPVNGQREYLYDIARKTLGDGNRYREIMDLNRSRRQDDGRVLNDPTDIRPGWILVLPPDADGPGVMTGVPPQAAPAEPGAPATTGPPVPASKSSGTDSSLDANLLRIGAYAVTFLLLVLAVRIVRGGRRAPREAAGSAPPGEADAAVNVERAIWSGSR